MKEELLDYTEPKTAASGNGASKPASVSFVHHLWASVAATVLLTVIVCGVYPLVVWGIAQVVFPGKANGSLVRATARRPPTTPRPSARPCWGRASRPSTTSARPQHARHRYDAASSSGSNLGPLSDKLINGTTKKDDKDVEVVDFDGIKLRTILYADDNGIEVEVLSGPPLASFRSSDGSYDGRVSSTRSRTRRPR